MIKRVSKSQQRSDGQNTLGDLIGGHGERAADTLLGWTQDRVDYLRKAWLRGDTASQIEASLGGTTRNAVIGKAGRLGLPGRGSPIGKRRAEPKEIARAPYDRNHHRRPVDKPRAVAVNPFAAVPAATPPHETTAAENRARLATSDSRRTFALNPQNRGAPASLRAAPTPEPLLPFTGAPVRMAELASNGCHWPVNNSPRADGHLFCGATQAPGCPYCETHRARAWAGFGNAPARAAE